jgi:hypothetical protein
VTITAPAEGWYRTATLPALAYTVVDDTDPNPTVVVTGWSTAEGWHVVTVTATDAAGNVGSDSASYGVDDTAPALTFGALSPAPNGAGWNNSPVSVSFEASDALSGVASVSAASPLAFGAEEEPLGHGADHRRAVAHGPEVLDHAGRGFSRPFALVEHLHRADPGFGALTHYRFLFGGATSRFSKGGFYCGRRGLAALVMTARASSRDGVGFLLGGEHPEGHGHAGGERGVHHASRRFPGNVLVVIGLAPYDRAEGDDGVVPTREGRGLGDQRKLEGPGRPLDFEGGAYLGEGRASARPETTASLKRD